MEALGQRDWDEGEGGLSDDQSRKAVPRAPGPPLTSLDTSPAQVTP